MLSLPVASARAATLFVGESRGAFGAPTVDPSIDSEATFRVENPSPQTEDFLLGEPGQDSAPNRLSFTGQGFSVLSEQTFSVGSLTYRNGQTFEGTNVSSVPLGISLDLIQPLQAQRSFEYSFTFNLTPNTAQGGSADSLVISENPAPQTLLIQDKTFSIELLGFSADDGNTFVSSFQIPEDQSVSSTLFAQITPVPGDVGSPVETPNGQPTRVPEPAILPSLLALGAVVRIKRNLLPAQR
ncbi:MAG: choice-of-anchor K domain-containing protein [Phormidesmis sp.]